MKRVKSKKASSIFSLMFVVTMLISVPILSAQAPPEKEFIDYVDPYIDTHQSRWFYFSSAALPFGMVSLSPDTNTQGSWRSGYLYDDKKIRCFSHIHGWQISGVAVLPAVGENKGNKGMDRYGSEFSHKDEIVKPGFHRVILKDYNIQAELTATTRVGFHRYKYPESKKSHIYFDTGAYLAHGPTSDAETKLVDSKTIEGWAIMDSTIRRPYPFKVYFQAKLNKEVVSSNPINGGGLSITFETQKDEEVLMKVAISYCSIENAALNMETEIPHWNFDQTKNEAFSEWNEKLSRIEITSNNEQWKTKFYTDLWHSLSGRKVVSDVNGQWCDMTSGSAKIRSIALDEKGVPLYQHHQFDAWWGSHWSLNILWSLVYPDVVDDFCNTMVDYYEYGGLIPRGPAGGNYTYVMIGDTAAPFLAAAAAVGIEGWDIEKAYEGLRKNAFPGGIRDHSGYEHSKEGKGGGMKDYIRKGYVPSSIIAGGYHNDGASMTLEYAYQDWCLAQIALKLNKMDDYNLFMKRSKNYNNVWNPKKGWMQARYRTGLFNQTASPYTSGSAADFCESSSAIYSYFVPHDPEGLIELFGGAEAFTKRLNSQFEQAVEFNFISGEGKEAKCVIDYSNQPGTGMAHLFNYSDAPELAQKWVREVKLKAHGRTDPYGGYNGDEDQGQMGALGVLMAIGLFSENGLAAAEPYLEITTPLFDSIVIHLNSQKFGKQTFSITTNDAEKNSYIHNRLLNQKKWDSWKLPIDQVLQGGSLNLETGEQPAK